MVNGYLLRFQESPSPSCGSDAATKTKTAVPKEQPDEGQVLPLAATKTITEVKREQPDADPSSSSFRTIPRP
jgi:hypothetical protein